MIVYCPTCLTQFIRETAGKGVFKKSKEKCGICLNEVVMLKGKQPTDKKSK